MTAIAAKHRKWIAAVAIALLALLVDAAAAEMVEVVPGVRVTKKQFPAPAHEQPFFGFMEKMKSSLH